MNDVMPLLDVGCTAFLKVAIGVTLLCFSRAALSFIKPKTSVHTTSGTSTTGSSNLWTHISYERKPELEPTKPEPIPVEEPEELIECGNCHQLIHSAPIKQVPDPAGPYEIYECEHCNFQVQVLL